MCICIYIYVYIYIYELILYCANPLKMGAATQFKSTQEEMEKSLQFSNLFKFQQFVFSFEKKKVHIKVDLFNQRLIYRVLCIHIIL